MSTRDTVVDRDEPQTLDGSGPTATAEFSQDRVYRYALTRTWDDRPPVAFVMLNPSTADAFQLDPTVRRCVDFARRWGGGGLLVLNAFALRSPYPQDLYKHPDPVGPDNDDAIREHLTELEPLRVIAAWGIHGAYRDRERAVARLITLSGHQPYCLRQTREGMPGHPLYVPADTPPAPWAGRSL